ncbi:hypothetical protein [Pseudomonas sp. PSE14]|uniref:hypothetical protein n=1 Tax=Pseudomonas sp. PSE14 TaxID=3016341 RepID=UPI0023D8902A|nr:hypothetical protein [Pseudomonas sp. PSE14]WEJ73077.1 hypothetical protein O6P39_04075 [Pseudomonas sp. PSE14]
MPIDLRALPEPLSIPPEPNGLRWWLIILLCAAVGGLLVTLFWPLDSRGASLWFWCCAVVFPLIAGLMLYALRRQLFEGQLDYVEGWNEARDEQRQALIERGQRRLVLLAGACCTAAGNNKLAQALRAGSIPLQPVYQEAQACTLRLSQLQPAAASLSVDEYIQRLSGYLRQVVQGIEEEWRTCAQGVSTRLRIRHSGVLSDEQVLMLWNAAGGDRHTVGPVVFAEQDDGLLWLDDWLDMSEPVDLLLSLEINAYLEPMDGYAESVSAVLLGRPEWCTKCKVTPEVVVHRPVRIGEPKASFEDALRWGGLLDAEDGYFLWLSQLPESLAGEMAIVMSGAGHPPDQGKTLDLDGVLGLAGCAVGNLTLIVASEQARTEREAQLVLLGDTSSQWCVVRSA